MNLWIIINNKCWKNKTLLGLSDPQVSHFIRSIDILLFFNFILMASTIIVLSPNFDLVALEGLTGRLKCHLL